MNRLVQEKLKEYLEAYGWVYRFEGNNICYSGWRTSTRSYSLKMQLSETLLFFEVGLLELGELAPQIHWKDIMEFLIRLNRQISVVKLGMDEEETIVLCAELFCEALTFELLSKVLGIFGYYCECVQEQIMAKIYELSGENPYCPRYLV